MNDINGPQTRVFDDIIRCWIDGAWKIFIKIDIIMTRVWYINLKEHFISSHKTKWKKVNLLRLNNLYIIYNYLVERFAKRGRNRIFPEGSPRHQKLIRKVDLRRFRWVQLCRIFDLSKNKTRISHFELSQILHWKKRRAPNIIWKLKS